MKKGIRTLALFFCSLFISSCSENSPILNVDVLVVGGGTSGVAAGLQSARSGVNTLIVEETSWLGGMLTSAGVSAVDGNYNLPAGIWGEFQSRLIAYYGSRDSLKTGWVSNVLFEPSVGNQVFCEMVNQEKNLNVYFDTVWKDIERENNCWKVTLLRPDGTTEIVVSKVLIDATELGDVAKSCGVGYDIGMESRDSTNESIAPDNANGIIQDLTYVAILKDYGVDVTIPEPKGYSPTEFACACANQLCKSPKEPDRIWSKDKMITYGKLPNNKYMINWPIEGNDYYINLVEMLPEERKEALQAAKDHTIRFIYFLQKELGYNTLGLADDEYPTSDKLPFIPYYRESRRIHGLVRFNLNHIMNPYDQQYPLYRTCIAVGDYPVDHHHTRYRGGEELPDLYFHPIPSYGLPLGVMIPKDIDGLIVAEKSISVSNIVNGTTRLQPVVLQIGQAAGALAALAVSQDKDIDEVSVRDVQDIILDSKGYLLPYLDVPVSDKRFTSYQRIGASGILRGKGKNVGWSNQTWLRADSVLLSAELEDLCNFYPKIKNKVDLKSLKPVSVEKLMGLIQDIAKSEGKDLSSDFEKIWLDCGLERWNPNVDITRGEMAVIVDHILDPFHSKAVNIKGEFIQ